jgi:hypothetical protein
MNKQESPTQRKVTNKNQQVNTFDLELSHQTKKTRLPQTTLYIQITSNEQSSAHSF